MRLFTFGRLSVACTLFLAGSALAAEQPEVFKSVRHDTSPPLRDLIKTMPIESGESKDGEELYIVPNVTEDPTQRGGADPTTVPENLLIDRGGNNRGDPPPAIIINFDALGNLSGVLPPDTNGDVGPTQYISYVNLNWAIFDKATGNMTDGPFLGNTFWAGFGGPCQTNNSGDPIVLYDKLADRWVFSQFTGSGSPRQCFAVSTTSDPLGPYHRYAFDFSPLFNDYPHIGIFTDASGDRSGYYFVTHDFQGQSFQQASFSVVERDEMLQGNPAQFVRFTNTAAFGGNAFGALPPHLESTEVPAAGTCAPFVDNFPGLNGYVFWNLCVDWDNAGNSTLSPPFLVEAGAPFDNSVAGVPQSNGATALDSFAGNTMYRSSVRAFPPASGLNPALLVSHVTNAGGGQHAVRYVQFELPGDDIFASGTELNEPNLFGMQVIKEGVYSPDGTVSRWMSAISMDQSGNIGLGYTVSNDSGVFPGIRYTAGNAGDTGLLQEGICMDGGGVQNSTSGRWGDYASTSVDPADQCTFWHHNEYYAATSNAGWQTHVCSFQVPNCGSPTLQIRTRNNPSRATCGLDGDPAMQFDLSELTGSVGNVNLATGALPGGTSVSFSSNPVSSLPATVTATFNNFSGLADGDYSAVVFASPDNGPGAALAYDFSVSSALAPAATLTAPSDGATGALVRPQLTWNALTEAITYRVDIATDSGFTNVVDSGVTDQTNYSPSIVLSENTQYFWRVTGLNNCGDGAVSSTFDFTTGVPGVCPAGSSDNVVFFDDVEGGINGWTTSGPGVTWAQSNVRQNSGQFSWFAVDVDTTTDQYLVSPSIALPSAGQAPLTLTFWNFQNIEANTGTGADACWDGGLLEISTNGGGSWTQIPDARMQTDPYNGPITTNAASPISGRDAWCADDIVPPSGDQEVVSIVDVTQFAGQNVQFRFRLGTDGAAGDEGWYIDDIEVKGCQ